MVAVPLLAGARSACRQRPTCRSHRPEDNRPDRSGHSDRRSPHGLVLRHPFLHTSGAAWASFSAWRAHRSLSLSRSPRAGTRRNIRALPSASREPAIPEPSSPPCLRQDWLPSSAGRMFWDWPLFRSALRWWCTSLAAKDSPEPAPPEDVRGVSGGSARGRCLVVHVLLRRIVWRLQRACILADDLFQLGVWAEPGHCRLLHGSGRVCGLPRAPGRWRPG